MSEPSHAPGPWLDPIALAYARHFDEVEAARSQFERQRTALLDRLCVVTRAALVEAGLEVVAAPEREDGWDAWSLPGQWAKIRHDVGRKLDGQSGVSIGLGHDACFAAAGGACFGFGTYAFFAMSADRYAKVRGDLTGAAQAHGAVVDHDPDGRIAYVRHAWIRPADDGFDPDTFEARVRALPALFMALDDAVALSYRQRKGG